MKNETVNAETAPESQVLIDDIVCYECKQTKFCARECLDGDCPLNLL
jgi:hypothetical protein